MISTKYYIGYYDGIALCTSAKKKAVKLYLERNRKLSPDQYDIIESYRKPDWYDSNGELIEYGGRYVTTLEARIIARDFKFFMDDAWTTYNNLEELLKMSTISEKKTIRSTLSIYEDLFVGDDIVKNNAEAEMFYKYFSNHDLLDINMQAYLAKLAASPSYFNP